ncbi:MAG TPA: SigE family RNA polymerase sigma factor [Acidimicrobiales bacterium]
MRPTETRSATKGLTGGDAAVAALYDEHFGRLVGVARLLLDDHREAEDVVQEAFIRLRTGWWRIREPDRAGAYLRATVVNLAHSGLRRRAVSRRRDPEHAAHLRVVGPAAEDTAVLNDEHRLVVEALALLPKRQRECLVLRYYLDLSEAEIARALDVTPGSVKTHVHRGMAALAHTLEDLA